MILQDIANSLDKIFKNVVLIDQDDYSQKVKDQSKRILSESIDMVNKELSESKINQLVYKEYKKRFKL